MVCVTGTSEQVYTRVSRFSRQSEVACFVLRLRRWFRTRIRKLAVSQFRRHDLLINSISPVKFINRVPAVPREASSLSYILQATICHELLLRLTRNTCYIAATLSYCHYFRTANKIPSLREKIRKLRENISLQKYLDSAQLLTLNFFFSIFSAVEKEIIYFALRNSYSRYRDKIVRYKMQLVI